MRDILFRGKRINNGIIGDFVYGNLVKYELPENRGVETYILAQEEVKKTLDLGGRIECDMIEVDPSTVGQDTGLIDKNGTRIFEGDRMRNIKTGEICTVAWHGTMAGYILTWLKENYQHIFDWGALFRVFDKYEVIGNIHDKEDKPQ